MKKNRSARAIIFTSIVLMFSAVSFAAGEAQVTDAFKSLGSIVNSLTKDVVGALVTLSATAALVAFFYGIVQYIWGIRDGKPDKVTAGNKFMVSGLIALFVMFSVWGIIVWVQKIFKIDGQNTIVIPNVKIEGGSSVDSSWSPFTGNTGNSSGVNTVSNTTALTPSPDGYCLNKAPGTACITRQKRQGTCGENGQGNIDCYTSVGGSQACQPGYVWGVNGCYFVGGLAE